MQVPIIEMKFFDLAAQAAQSSLCLRDRCGAVIVLKGQVIASGYNAPPKDDIANRKCHLDFPIINRRKPKASCQCCDHAEIRAVTDLIKNTRRRKFDGTVMYFTRIDNDGRIQTSGEPYCVECSRLAFHHGISFWALNHNDGPRLYGAKEYYDLSYEYHLTTLQ